MPILMIYPPAIPFDAAAQAAFKSCLAHKNDEVLFKNLSGLRQEWYVGWIERNAKREGLSGVLSRPYSRA
jgi:hypothetical protein